MARLFEKGYISDPRGETKSVVFTEQGGSLSFRSRRLKPVVRIDTPNS